jgi:low temperature requirement protein LtrA
MPDETVRGFRDWFWRPPRPHGATIRDRVVTNLELFYDLVYVAVIGQAANHLSEDVSSVSIAGFAIVFAMIWFAWINGSLYLEIHGRQDGRTRSFVFLQMGILVLLAVFTAGATGPDGPAFGLVYAALFAVMGWLWFSVRGQDESQFRTPTAAYALGMAISVAVIVATAFLPTDPRIAIWAAFCAAWLAAFAVIGRIPAFAIAMSPTQSLVERFGLFTIIVLGEVVIGVVDGLSRAGRDPVTIATGLLALSVGFGFWWSYFDIVGRRLPRPAGQAVFPWVLSHLPITMAIAAAGAGMTSLIAHAHDASPPPATGWLLAGAVAVALLGLILTSLSLEDARRLPAVYRKIASTMAVGATAAVIVAWLEPTAWLSALALAAILSIVWAVAIGRFLRAHAWSELESEAAVDRGAEHLTA